jgi:endonuclease/exonuclease/phosphatase family metal-dependent hydrolase
MRGWEVSNCRRRKDNREQHCFGCTQSNQTTKRHGTFSKIDHILGHKASLNKDTKIEITPCILSDHSLVNLELNNKSSIGWMGRGRKQKNLNVVNMLTVY